MYVSECGLLQSHQNASTRIKQIIPTYNIGNVYNIPQRVARVIYDKTVNPEVRGPNRGLGSRNVLDAVESVYHSLTE